MVTNIDQYIKTLNKSKHKALSVQGCKARCKLDIHYLEFSPKNRILFTLEPSNQVESENLNNTELNLSPALEDSIITLVGLSFGTERNLQGEDTSFAGNRWHFPLSPAATAWAVFSLPPFRCGCIVVSPCPVGCSQAASQLQLRVSWTLHLGSPGVLASCFYLQLQW